jgi:hypothetical protein
MRGLTAKAAEVGMRCGLGGPRRCAPRKTVVVRRILEGELCGQCFAQRFGVESCAGHGCDVAVAGTPAGMVSTLAPLDGCQSTRARWHQPELPTEPRHQCAADVRDQARSVLRGFAGNGDSLTRHW